MEYINFYKFIKINLYIMLFYIFENSLYYYFQKNIQNFRKIFYNIK